MNVYRIDRLEEQLRPDGPSRPPDTVITLVDTETVRLSTGEVRTFDLPGTDFDETKLMVNADGSRCFLRSPRREVEEEN